MAYEMTKPPCRGKATEDDPRMQVRAPTSKTSSY